MNCEWAKKFKWKFTKFSVHPSLFLHKLFLTHFNLIKHLMALIVITLLFFLSEQMFSPTVWCMFALMETVVVSTVSKVYLSKGCSLLFSSILTNPYLTPIRKICSRSNIRKNVENFVEICLLTLCWNKTPSIILGQSQGLPSGNFTNESLMVLFCRSQSPFDWEWYAEVMRCTVPTMLCKSLLTSLTNSLPWSLIWNFIHPCRHTTW